MYLEPAKMDKQLKYADKKNIPFAVIIGTQELEQKNAIIKNLATREQFTVAQHELNNRIW